MATVRSVASYLSPTSAHILHRKARLHEHQVVSASLFLGKDCLLEIESVSRSVITVKRLASVAKKIAVLVRCIREYPVGSCVLQPSHTSMGKLRSRMLLAKGILL